MILVFDTLDDSFIACHGGLKHAYIAAAAISIMMPFACAFLGAHEVGCGRQCVSPFLLKEIVRIPRHRPSVVGKRLKHISSYKRTRAEQMNEVLHGRRFGSGRR